MNHAQPRDSNRDVVRVGLAVLLAAMAAGQLSDVGAFVDVLASYQVGGTVGAAISATGLIAGEATAATSLLARAGRRRRVASTVALAVAVAWTLLGAQAFARGLVLANCGCFGVRAAQPLRWWVLIEDVEFVALAWWVRARSATPSRGYSSREDAPPVAV